MSRYSPETEASIVLDRVETVDEPTEVELMLGIIRAIPDAAKQYSVARRMAVALEGELPKIIARTARKSQFN